ncbi:hypothetical protein SteCoe_25166 [Stentor coeruleus]|uniref:Uncharacterized protein n=1 Tax=Stentor coeruleus TaxID=5963 RepID=A0A1R2BFU2_9CILI|nr:hypothetical protein SteCoe_25166 [Stentor coeruleus]
MKKWFKKKDKNNNSEETSTPPENYTAMNSNSLYSLPVNELVSIIFRFDVEVKNMTKELTSAKESLVIYKADLPKAQEQSLLYKQHNETLQTECNKLASELNEATTALCSRQSQLDLLKNQFSSKDELIQNYKSKIQELEKQNLELQITGIDSKPENDVLQLKAKLEDSSRALAEISELQIKNKTYESEIAKLSACISEDKEQIRMWKDKTNVFENSRKELEIELNKKRIEAESLASEVTRLSFLKESLDTEIRALRESNGQKDLRINKKVGKIETLQNSNLELQQKISVLRYEMDTSKTKMQEEFLQMQERAKEEKNKDKKVYEGKIEGLEKQLKDLNDYKSSNEGIREELERLKQENKSQQELLSNTLSELHQKTIKITTLESENSKLSDHLNKSNNKRELARTEILKLTQKLESLTSSKSPQSPQVDNKPKFLLNPVPQEPNNTVKFLSNPTQQEIDILTFIKTELDSIYKSLMRIISPADSSAYLIKIDDFSTIEKRLNNIVMQLHEQLDEISEEQSLAAKPQVPQQIVKPPKGRNPIKLFSCIAQQDEPPRLIPKPKRPPIQEVDNRMVLRRGSAN